MLALVVACLDDEMVHLEVVFLTFHREMAYSHLPLGGVERPAGEVGVNVHAEGGARPFVGQLHGRRVELLHRGFQVGRGCLQGGVELSFQVHLAIGIVDAEQSVERSVVIFAVDGYVVECVRLIVQL